MNFILFNIIIKNSYHLSNYIKLNQLITMTTLEVSTTLEVLAQPAKNNKTVILIDKNGTVKESIMLNFHEDNLFKKCSFKTDEDFKVQYEWKKINAPEDAIKIDNETKKTIYNLVLYGRDKGKSTTEINYTFPLNNTLKLFGTCVFLLKQIIYNRETRKQESQNIINLSLSHWNKIIDKLNFVQTSTTEDKEEDDNDNDNNDNAIQLNFEESVSKNILTEQSLAILSEVSKESYTQQDVDDHSDSSSSFNSLTSSDSEADDEAEGEEQEIDDDLSLSDEDAEAEVDDAEVDDVESIYSSENNFEDENENEELTEDNIESTKKSVKAGAKKRGRKGEKQLQANELFDLSILEKDELVSEGYLSTDDENFD